MARYADGLIAEGEHIVLRTRQHWFSIVAYTVAFWVLVAVSVGFFLLGRLIDWSILGWVAADLVPRSPWSGSSGATPSWTFQDYIVTNRRVMQVEGIINKISRDSSLEKINDAVLKQGLFGRLLHFGDLEILTASEKTIDDFRMLNDAARFKKAMLNAKTPSSGRSPRRCPARRSGPRALLPPTPPLSRRHRPPRPGLRRPRRPRRRRRR